MAEFAFTSKDIAKLRDEDHLSWAKVAEALALGSPGSARRAYTTLVRPHTESVLPGRSANGAAVQPIDLTDASLATVRELVAGRTIVVERSNGPESIPVAKVTSLKNGNVNFNDGHKSRSVKAAAVVGVK